MNGQVICANYIIITIINIDISMMNDSGCWQNHAEGNEHKPLLLVSAAALIDDDGCVLLAQRPNNAKQMANLWEFPGGKIEQGESPEFALIRELNEELNIVTQESCLAPIAFSSHAYDNFHLLMPVFAIRVWQGDIALHYHQHIHWVKPVRLTHYDMPAANYTIAAMVRDFLS